MNTTPIEWTDFSANPIKFRAPDGRVVWACEKISPGCTNCYAEHLSTRYGGVRRAGTWNAATMATLTPFLDEAELRKMLTAKTVGGKTVSGSRCFVGDMTDIFGEWVPDALLDRLFAVFAMREDVTWQVLTKRAARLLAYLTNRLHALDIYGHFQTLPGYDRVVWKGIPLPNVHLGVSVEDQPRADERIPLLLQTPAAIRFISAEPLLGPVDLSRYVKRGTTYHISADVNGMIANRSFDCLTDDGKPMTRAEAEAGLRALAAKGVKQIRSTDACVGFSDQTGCPGHREPHLDWVIVGGESGAGARPMHPDWARSIRDRCRAAGVKFFFKQYGAWVPFYDRDKDDPDWRDVPKEESEAVKRINLTGGCGFHGERVIYFRKAGKKAAGRVLDGLEHNEFPEVRA